MKGNLRGVKRYLSSVS